MKKNMWIAGLAMAAAVGIGTLAPLSARAEGRIPEGVSVGELELSGMTEEEAKARVNEYVNEKLSGTIVLTVDGNEVSASAEELGLSWSNQDAVEEALSGTEIKGNLIKRYLKKKELETKPVNVSLEMAADQEKISAFVNEKCAPFVTAPKDATITKTDGQFVITPAETGKTVDIAATEKALSEALNTGTGGTITVEAVITEQEPAVTEEDLETIQDVLGTFSTDFSSSSSSRVTNLQVGAGKINGHVLMPGEVLSGYECMHPFTVANGYKAATAYENGRSVDSIGGGVCQISTTLYNASLLAELEIVQRQNHSMTVSYVKPSMDAAIAGTYKDLKIKNPYDTPIYVEGYTSGKTLTFTIYGKETRPSNRTIAFESETLQRIDPGAPAEQVDASLAPGQRVRVQSGHTGVKSRLYKCVYVDGELKERTLLHNDTYNASKAIYRVGPAAPAVAEPTETAPVETPPAETPAAETPAETPPAGPGYEGGPGFAGDSGSAPEAPAGDTPAGPASPGPQPSPETPAPQPETPAETPAPPISPI